MHTHNSYKPSTQSMFTECAIIINYSAVVGKHNVYNNIAGADLGSREGGLLSESN